MLLTGAHVLVSCVKACIMRRQLQQVSPCRLLRIKKRINSCTRPPRSNNACGRISVSKLFAFQPPQTCRAHRSLLSAASSTHPNIRNHIPARLPNTIITNNVCHLVELQKNWTTCTCRGRILIKTSLREPDTHTCGMMPSSIRCLGEWFIG